MVGIFTVVRGLVLTVREGKPHARHIMLARPPWQLNRAFVSWDAQNRKLADFSVNSLWLHTLVTACQGKVTVDRRARSLSSNERIFAISCWQHLVFCDPPRPRWNPARHLTTNFRPAGIPMMTWLFISALYACCREVVFVFCEGVPVLAGMSASDDEYISIFASIRLNYNFIASTRLSSSTSIPIAVGICHVDVSFDAWLDRGRSFLALTRAP